MTQIWMVGVLVGLAAAYTLWYLLPTSTRRSLGRVHSRLGQSPACGACSDCGKCDGHPARPDFGVQQPEFQPISFYRQS